MLAVDSFTDQAPVLQLLADLEQDGIPQRMFSDVVDGAGRQHVNLVMKGSGVLSIALVGHPYVLEQIGMRFLQLEGTSAEAINVMLLAAAGPIDAEKGLWTLERLVAKNLHELVDGDHDARDFIDTACTVQRP